MKTDIWLADKDQAALEAHMTSEFFQNLGKAIGAEELLAKPLDIKKIKPFAGFVSR